MLFFLQLFFTTLRWLFSIILLIFALNLKNPYLLWGREYLTLVIISLSFIHSFFIVGSIKLTKQVRKVEITLLLVLITTLTATAFNEAKFQFHKYKVLNAENSVLQKLGKHMVIGYETVEELTPLISTGAIAGVFITKKNIQGKSYQQIKALISQFQKIRTESGLSSLIIATDQEGGIVSRFSPPLTKLPALASIIQGKKIAEAIVAAKKQGETHGKELFEIGVNVNFSPVVDLRNNNEINPLDFHSLINKRAISNDKTITSQVALSYSLGLEKQGVIPTLKHFPGMGRVVEDTHHFGAKVSTTRALLERSDWIPFKYILKRANSFMMLGHVVLSELDNEHPVSYSKKVIQEIIRQSWNYNGVLITDDLTMHSIYSGEHGLCDSSVMALNAGVDLLLVSYDYQQYYPVMACLIEAYQEGNLDEKMLLSSEFRIKDVTKKVWNK